ncbi:MAG: hypothetical protein BWK76_10620 [Desulfobulbaceae bacterium A2]|nr:MAG: hypothetical protein BWK76_10620 [Desulfobulbaceae bacterium A2]
MILHAGLRKTLAYRLVLSILVFSSVAALLSTMIQLFFEYRRDMGSIETTVAQIQNSHVGAIVPSLWVYDLAMLETQLQGIKNLPDISYASLWKDEQPIAEVGRKTEGGQGRLSVFPLVYSHRGQEQHLGILQVEVSLLGVYQRLWDRVIVILATQSLKTFCVSIFIFFLFYSIVGRHLKTMADFARALSLQSLDTPLVLQRKAVKGAENDELGLVESAINNMRHNLIQEMDSVRLAQDALAQSEERFRTLVANIPGIVYRSELLPPWHVHYISDRIEQLTGRPSQDFVLGTVALGQLIHSEDLAAVAATVQRQVAARAAFEVEYRIRHVDGRISWVFANGQVICDEHQTPVWLDGVILDISEKKQTEQQLREQDLLLHSIIENTSDAIFCKDTMGRYVLANSAALDAMGHSRQEVIGKTDFELFPRESAEIIQRNDAQVLSSLSPLIAEEQLQIASGESFWHTNKSPLLDAQGTLRGLVGISRDITEWKRAQQRNEELERKYLQAQKMETVGRLAGGVAHDFNNMLNVILGYTEIVQGELPRDSPSQGALLEIRKAAQRSAELTRQLLAFARKQTVAPEVLDLNEAVEGMLRMLQRLMGEDIDLAWRPGKLPGPVKMDPAQIEQLLANLCVNARDAIADTGKITIETGTAIFDASYCAEHPGFLAGEYVLLAVSDNGCGMDKNTMANIFEPFFTTKESGKGTGLGLSMVYGIVKQNNGFINVYSEPGQGTCFKIYLAKHQGEPEWMPKEEIQPTMAGGHETLLLVEDEPMLMKMTTAMLNMQGYTVLAAITPGEAIHLSREHAGTIHLLITDVVMPEMNGRDLARYLHGFLPGLRCLFMSGYTANVIAHHGVLDPGVHFLQKPFSSRDLAARVREVLDAPYPADEAS